VSRAHSQPLSSSARRGSAVWRASSVAAALACVGIAGPASAQQAPASSPSAGAPAAAGAVTPTPAVAVTPASSGARLEDAIGQSGGLTADDAGRRAAETSVQAAVEREKVAGAKNDRSRVIWDNLPTLNLGARYTRLSKVPGLDFNIQGVPPLESPQNNYSLSASVSVPFTEYLLRMVTALRGAGDNVAAAQLTEQVSRNGADVSAKLAYYDWVRARLGRVLAEQALDQAKAQLRRVEALHAAGRAAEADLLQARAFQADAELALTAADTQQAILEQRLRTLVHAPSEERWSVGENVLAPFPGSEEPRSLEELYREAESQRLEFQALERGERALDRLHTIERTRALPRLEGFGNFTYANPNQRIFPQQDKWDDTWEVGLSLTWSSADLGHSVTTAESVRVQRDELRHQRTQALENLRLEVAGAYRALAQARSSIVTAEQGERAAVAALEARARLEEQGLATALELMQAQTAQAQARLNLLNAHIALRVARVQLDHALGRDGKTGG
jgi:outer membrane protein TolC